MKRFLKSVSKVTSFSIGRMFREVGHDLEITGSRLQDDISYLEPLSRHRSIMPLYDLRPIISADVFIAPNASIIGEVEICKDSMVWYGAVIRGDLNAVRIGSHTSIGDGTVIHTTSELPSGMPASVNIGNGVTIQPQCTLYSCCIDHQAFIGAKTTILEGARVETGAVIGPNSVVPPGRVIPASQIWSGNPVKYVRDVEKLEEHHLELVSRSLEYIKDKHLAEFESHPTSYLQRKNTESDLNFKKRDMKAIGEVDHDQELFFDRSDSGKLNSV